MSISNSHAEQEPDYRPFTDSILSDIHALPVPVRQRLAIDIATRYIGPPAVDWASLITAAVILAGSLFLRTHVGELLAGAHVHHHFSTQTGWFVLGLAAMAVLDGLAAFIGSVHAAIAIRRHRRNYGTTTPATAHSATGRIGGDRA
jgi:hypothetical protein